MKKKSNIYSRVLRKSLKYIFVALVLLLLLCFVTYTFYSRYYSQKTYTAVQLGIDEIISKSDADNDGIDDYSDILLGARKYIKTKPKYKSKYYYGGYPDDGYGVCTDVIWNGFKSAGYDLKNMIDTDIANNLEAYTTITSPEQNIDFRRVRNLKIFFDRNAEILTTKLTNPEEWQAGDIVVFSNHIAICSDKRNKEGYPFIIHHGDRGAREKNEIRNYTIVGHYRWNGMSIE